MKARQLTPTSRALGRLIDEAFADVSYPGDDGLVDSPGRDPEAQMVVEAFRGKSDSDSLDPDFLDAAPGGLGSALSFFSPAALRFYLPAYMKAFLSVHFERVDLIFHLTHGFTHETPGFASDFFGQSMDRSKHPAGLKSRGVKALVTDLKQQACARKAECERKYSGLTLKQVEAVIAYLEHERATDPSCDEANITEALTTFWYPRRKALGG